MKALRKCLTSLVLLVLVVFLSRAAEWQGFWGGWQGKDPNVPHYPGTEAYEPGSWQDPPICYALEDTPRHSWTSAEKAVARAAISEWNEAPSGLKHRIFEGTDPICRNRPIDIRLRWENTASFFKDWGDPNRDGNPLNASGAVGMYVPIRVAPPLKIEPCPDLKAAGFLEPCSVVFFNLDNPNGWFIDPTPGQDEEFEPVTVTLCGVPKTVLKAKKGTPAAGKQDLYTVILHEFGHALGLVHSGGCDKNLLTGPPHDDDGTVMWEGFLTQRRDLEDIVRGLDERVHLSPEDSRALETLYPRSTPSRVTSFPSGGQEPKGIAAGSLIVVNNQSHTAALIEPRSGQLEAIIGVGTFPVDVAADQQARRAYTANFGSDDVSVIDLESRRVTETLGVGRQPSAVAFNSNRLFVANFGDSTLSIFESSARGHRLVTTLSGIREPLDVAISPDGRFGYVVSILSRSEICLPIVGCVTQETGGVLTIDLSTLQVIRTVRFEGELRQLAVSPDGRRLYVTARAGGQGQLLVLDAATGQILQAIPVGQKPYGVAVSPEGCFVVVANSASHDISVVDAQGGRVVATLKDAQAREPWGVVVLGSRAYVTNRLSHTISVFELGACP
jgi:YVTN family beta-propeller protein